MPGKLVNRMSKKECYTLNVTNTIKEASKRLHEKKIGCMPVEDDNKNIIGIISERDLSRLIYAEKFNINLPVEKIMTKDLVTCDLNTSVTELMDTMTQKKLGRIIFFVSNRRSTGCGCAR